ncbi:hypothetical protein NKF06_19170 [Haloferax sp. AB510]|uniref:hypothetical protein n=1 Tax=Haloferax sp. AB510 TaxID=2934172 RepID=UPI00209BE16C|nr:hypothetical protein [Haloferax sp. AB510]MCO8268642.1 hypothetical protein [Haloferax sp. AB510]
MTTETEKQPSDPARAFSSFSGTQGGGQWDKEEISRILKQVEQKQKEAKHHREEQFKELSEKIRNETERLESLEQLKSENSELESKVDELNEELSKKEQELDEYRHSVPNSAFAFLAVGLAMASYGALVATDPVYLIGGLGISAVAVTAIYESKVLGNRKS